MATKKCYFPQEDAKKGVQKTLVWARNCLKQIFLILNFFFCLLSILTLLLDWCAFFRFFFHSLPFLYLSSTSLEVSLSLSLSLSCFFIYFTMVTSGKGDLRLLRAMQLKIAQKILNLSFYDKNPEQTLNSPNNPQIFSKILKNLTLQIF